MGLTPQAVVIRRHLIDVGSITNVEANAVYKCRSVSRRITEIARADPSLLITKERKVDHTGQRYVRYTATPIIPGIGFMMIMSHPDAARLNA